MGQDRRKSFLREVYDFLRKLVFVDFSYFLSFLKNNELIISRFFKLVFEERAVFGGSFAIFKTNFKCILTKIYVVNIVWKLLQIFDKSLLILNVYFIFSLVNFYFIQLNFLFLGLRRRRKEFALVDLPAMSIFSFA